VSLHLNDEETMLVDTVREFVDREVTPPCGRSSTPTSTPTRWIEQMKRIGIFGLAVPEEYGGTPVSTPCYVEVTQELARGWMSLAGAMGGHTVVAKLVSQFGTDEQKQKYLPAMASGDMRATMALTEPGGGSDLQNMTTAAAARATSWSSTDRKRGSAMRADPVSSPCCARPTPVPCPSTRAFRWYWSSTEPD
jgi:butyryl-CoA dehydrogenase